MARGIPAIVLVLTLSLSAASFAEPLAVIVHRDRADRLDVSQIGQIYLKQRRFWPDGQRMVPVNREAGNGLRSFFEKHVLRTSATRLAVYWNRQYFQGVMPPATLASDEAVKRFIASERAAIGYVDPRVLDESVRVVFQLGSAP